MTRKQSSTIVRLIGSNEGYESKSSAESHLSTHPWWRVLWLTGVDYFSTLAYQPGIAFLAAGVFSPLATLLLVMVTLFGALPVYTQVATRSHAGQGSIAMLERLLAGWWSKSCVLILLGFAATDFIITITLSAADAAQHIVKNHFLSSFLVADQMSLTLGLISALGFVFLIGFKEAIRIAFLIAVPYIILNLIVLMGGITELIMHPELISAWSHKLSVHGDMVGIILICTLVFPKLALGLSGFETAVSTMPLISDKKDSTSGSLLSLRIGNTHKLLIAAAVIMSVMLIMSSFVTTLLIDPAEFAEGGRAYGRAISFLAHRLFGWQLGTVYDLSTIAILWFAGASAMTGLLHLIPRYLPKFGMAPAWVAYTRPLVLLILLFTVVITLIFDANVEAQSGAYATGVLVLILSASFAVALSLWRELKPELPKLNQKSALLKSIYFWLVTGVFAYTLIDNILQRIDGILVAAAFIGITIVVGMLSRAWRATELRVSKLSFINEASARKWEEIQGNKIHLVPLRWNHAVLRKQKTSQIRKHYFIDDPLAFLYIELSDDRSEFVADLQAEIFREEGNYVIIVKSANSLANTIAFISEAIHPKSIFLSLTRKNLMAQALRFVLWGEGETGILVYRILLRHWESTNRSSVRPFIFLMSD